MAFRIYIAESRPNRELHNFVFASLQEAADKLWSELPEAKDLSGFYFEELNIDKHVDWHVYDSLSGELITMTEWGRRDDARRERAHIRNGCTEEECFCW